MTRVAKLFMLTALLATMEMAVGQEPPIILEVEITYDDSRLNPPADTIYIKGLNFDVLSDPEVVLATDITSNLHIEDSNNTEILAVCPNQQCPRGKNVVVAVRDPNDTVSFFNTRLVSFPEESVDDSQDTNTLLNRMYPVGSIYVNAESSDNPGDEDMLGFGEWESFGAGRVLVGLDSSDVEFDAALATGGSKTHTLTTNEIPSNLNFTINQIRGVPGAGAGIVYAAEQPGVFPNDGQVSADGVVGGNGQAHNNLQPYIVVYMWRRTN